MSRVPNIIAGPISRYHCKCNSKERYLTVEVALKIFTGSPDNGNLHMNNLPKKFLSDIVAYFKIQDVTGLSNFPDDFKGQASSNLIVSQASHILFHMQ